MKHIFAAMVLVLGLGAIAWGDADVAEPIQDDVNEATLDSQFETQQYNQLVTDQHYAEKQAKSAKKQYTQAQKMAEKMKLKNQALQEKIKLAMKNLHSEEAILQAETNKLDQAQSKLKGTEEKMNQVRANAQTVKQKRAELKRTERQVATEVAKLSRENGSIVKQMNQIEHQIKVQVARNKSLGIQKARLAAQNFRLHHQFQKKEAKLQGLKSRRSV